MTPREQHMIKFSKLSPSERLNWSLNTAWATFNALPKDKQVKYLKMKAHGKHK